MSSFPYDLRDKRAIAARASIVITGTVLRVAGTVPRVSGSSPPRPQTQFDVQVLESLKGDRRGVVRINQWMGFDRGRVVVHGTGWQLQVGANYLLAAKYSVNFDFFSLLPGTGVARLPDESSPNGATATDEFVDQWRDAIEKAKPPTTHPPAIPPPN